MSHVKQVRHEAEVILPEAGEKYIGEDGSVTKILEDFVDEDYEPTDEEIQEFAEFIGMKLPEDEEFLYIARNALKMPLPKEWKPCKTDGDNIYYFNFKTGESKWEHPMDELAQRTFENEKAKKAKRESNGASSPLKTDPLKSNEDKSSKSSPKATKAASNTTNTSEENALPLSSRDPLSGGEKKNASQIPKSVSLFPKVLSGRNSSSRGSESSAFSANSSASSLNSFPMQARSTLTGEGIIQKEGGKGGPSAVFRLAEHRGKPGISDSPHKANSASNNSLSSVPHSTTTARRVDGGVNSPSSYLSASSLGMGLSLPSGREGQVEGKGIFEEEKGISTSVLGPRDAPEKLGKNGDEMKGMGSATFRSPNGGMHSTSDALTPFSMEASLYKGASFEHSSTSSPLPHFLSFPSNSNACSEAPLRSEAEEMMIAKIRQEILQELQVQKDTHEKELNEKSRVMREEHTKRVNTLTDENTKERNGWKEEQKEKVAREIQTAKSNAAAKYSDDYHELERRAEKLHEELERMRKSNERLDTTYKVEKEMIERDAAGELKKALQEVVTEVEKTKRQKEEELEEEYFRKKTELEKNAQSTLLEQQKEVDTIYDDKIQKANKDFGEKMEKLQIEKTKLAREVQALRESNSKCTYLLSCGTSTTASGSFSDKKDEDSDNANDEEEEILRRIVAIEKTKNEKLEKMRLEAEKERVMRRESQQVEIEKMYYFIDVAKKTKEKAEATLREIESDLGVQGVQGGEQQQKDSSLNKSPGAIQETEKQIKLLMAEKEKIRKKWNEEKKAQLAALEKVRKERLALFLTSSSNNIHSEEDESAVEDSNDEEESIMKEKDAEDKNIREMQEFYDREIEQQTKLYKAMEEGLDNQLAKEREKGEAEGEAELLEEAIGQELESYIMQVLSRRRRLEKEYQVRLEKYEREVSRMKKEAKVEAERRRRVELESKVAEALKMRHDEVTTLRSSENVPELTGDDDKDALASPHSTREMFKEEGKTISLDANTRVTTKVSTEVAFLSVDEETEKKVENLEKRALPLLEKVGNLGDPRGDGTKCGRSTLLTSILSTLDSTRLEEVQELEQHVRSMEAAYASTLTHRRERNALDKNVSKVSSCKGEASHQLSPPISHPVTSFSEGSHHYSNRSSSSHLNGVVDDRDGGSGTVEGDISPCGEEESGRWVRRMEHEAHLQQLETVYQELQKYLRDEVKVVGELIQMVDTTQKRKISNEGTGTSSNTFLPLFDMKAENVDPTNTSSSFPPFASCSGFGMPSRVPGEERPSLSIHAPSSMVPAYQSSGVAAAAANPPTLITANTPNTTNSIESSNPAHIFPFSLPLHASLEYMNGSGSNRSSTTSLGPDDAIRLLQMQQKESTRRYGLLQAAKATWERQLRERGLVPPPNAAVTTGQRFPGMEEGVHEPHRVARDLATITTTTPGAVGSLPHRGDIFSAIFPTKRRGSLLGSGKGMTGMEGGNEDAPPFVPVMQQGVGVAATIGESTAPSLPPAPPTPVVLSPSQRVSFYPSEKSLDWCSAVSVADARQLHERLDVLTHHVHLLTQETAQYRYHCPPHPLHYYYTNSDYEKDYYSGEDSRKARPSTPTSLHASWSVDTNRSGSSEEKANGKETFSNLRSHAIPYPLFHSVRGTRKQPNCFRSGKSKDEGKRNKNGGMRMGEHCDIAGDDHSRPSPIISHQQEEQKRYYVPFSTTLQPESVHHDPYRGGEDFHSVAELRLQDSSYSPSYNSSSVLYRFLNSPSQMNKSSRSC